MFHHFIKNNASAVPFLLRTWLRNIKTMITSAFSGVLNLFGYTSAHRALQEVQCTCI